MSDGVVFHSGYFGNVANQEVGERNRVTKNVAGDAVASLRKLESPSEQTKFVTAIHRQEATAVVGHSADCAA